MKKYVCIIFHENEKFVIFDDFFEDENSVTMYVVRMMSEEYFAHSTHAVIVSDSKTIEIKRS